MAEFDVHFAITGFYKVSAESKQEAANKVNRIINGSSRELEGILFTGIKDDDYVTEVLEEDR